MQIPIKYEAGHTYTEEWEQFDFHCPHCGNKTVWGERDAGDYYVGAEWLCTSCWARWTWQLEAQSVSENWQDRQRREALAGVVQA